MSSCFLVQSIVNIRLYAIAWEVEHLGLTFVGRDVVHCVIVTLVRIDNCNWQLGTRHVTVSLIVPLHCFHKTIQAGAKHGPHVCRSDKIQLRRR